MNKLNPFTRLTAATMAVGFASIVVLTGCGNTPDDNTAAKYLPADTEAFGTLALSPSLSQKGSLALLSQKLPSQVRNSDKKNVTDKLLQDLFSNDEDNIDYNRDIKPWLGSEAAFAVLPPTDSTNTPIAVAIIQTKDQQKTEALFQAHHVDAQSYRYMKGYEWIIDKTQIADHKAATAFDDIQQVINGKSDSLQDRANYKSDLKLLHGQHLALGWADVSTLTKQAIAEAKSESTKSDDDPSALGGLGLYAQTLNSPNNSKEWDKLQSEADSVKSVAFELYAESNAVTFDSVTEGSIKGGTPSDQAILKGLANDITGALDVGGFGDLVRSTVTQAEQTTPADHNNLETAYPGFHELVGTLGNEFTFVDTGDYTKYGVAATVNDQSAASDAVTKLLSSSTVTGTFNVTPLTVQGGSGYQLTEKASSPFGSVGGSGVSSDDTSSFDSSANDDSTFGQAALPDPSNVSIDIVVANKRLAISGDQQTAVALASGTGNFSSSANYSDAFGSQTNPTHGAMYVNIKTIVKDVQQKDPDGFNKLKPEEKSWLQSLNNLGIQSWDEGGHSHLRLHLTFG